VQVTCKQCGAPIGAEALNLDRLVAKCAFCNAVFSFADQLEPAEQPRPAAERFAVPMPKGFDVQARTGQLQIVRKWFSGLYIFLTVFTLFWNGFMVVWFTIALTQGIWPMAAFGTLHGAVGIGLLYYTLAGYLNKTVIQVDRRELTITHGPLPWPGNRRLNPFDLAQLYTRERLHHHRNSTSTTYEVYAILQDGTRQKLLSGLHEIEQALYIEQEIERFLEIEDRPVRGELAR
jgi:hypothetical protein